MKKPYRLSRLLSVARRNSFLREDITRRNLTVETLETRSLMAGLPGMLFTSHYNAKLPADVNNDGQVKIDDAVAVISTLRKQGAHTLATDAAGEGEASSTTDASKTLYYDVNADSQLNITDAVSVIRTLRENGEGAPGDQVQFRVIATAVGGDGTNALTQIEKGQEFDLVVWVKDLRPRGSFAGAGATRLVEFQTRSSTSCSMPPKRISNQMRPSILASSGLPPPAASR